VASEVTIACPWTKDALLLQRHRQASANSCGGPLLFIGAKAMEVSSAFISPESPWAIGVLQTLAPIPCTRLDTYSTIPGHTQLILMLSFEYFKASTKRLENLDSHIDSITLRHQNESRFSCTIRSYSILAPHLFVSLGWYTRVLYVDTIPNWLAILTIAPLFPARPSWVGNGSCFNICASSSLEESQTPR
jgi:hypothetical protein